jgi:hypothetical protein
MDWSLLAVASSIIFTLLGGLTSLTWWLSNQFSMIRNLIYSKIEETKSMVLEKLEYHERHDDQRFAEVRNDIWDIRVRNAMVDGKLTPPPTKPTEKPSV